jgi:hypothetical protein
MFAVMNIVDRGQRWRLTINQIENLRTGQVRKLENTPRDYLICELTDEQFLNKCTTAFATGFWPH